MKYKSITLALLTASSLTIAQMHKHHDFPAAVTQFHNLMAPLWHSPPGGERSAAICKLSTKLLKDARGIDDALVPEGVDPADWKSATARLIDAVDQVQVACTKKEGSANDLFGDVHESFHQLVRLVGHSH